MAVGSVRELSDLGMTDSGESKGAANVGGDHTAGNAAVFAEALRSPAGIRQAIIVNELLSRPKALRR